MEYKLTRLEYNAKKCHRTWMNYAWGSLDHIKEVIDIFCILLEEFMQSSHLF